jgi:DNA-directed RNA polymerase delta subunit
MLEISTEKVAHVIIRAREYDAKTGSWEDALASGFRDDSSDAILENFSTDSIGSELAQFIADLNDDEQASLVALTWLGRGSFSADELDEAISTAKTEKISKTQDYLMGIPLLADYLEDGLEKLGYSVDQIEKDLT